MKIMIFIVQATITLLFPLSDTVAFVLYITKHVGARQHGWQVDVACLNDFAGDIIGPSLSKPHINDTAIAQVYYYYYHHHYHYLLW